MLTGNRAVLRMLGQCLLFAIVLATWSPKAFSQVWDAVGFFRYNIEKIGVIALPTTPPSYSVKIVFSVTNPANADSPWDIKNAVPFQSNAAQLTFDIGWDSSFDFTNKGSNGGTLTPLTGSTDAAAFPVRIASLTSNAPATAGNAKACTVADCGPTEANRFFSVATVTPLPFGAAVKTGRVVLEGRPVCNGSVYSVTCPLPTYSATAPLVPIYANIPVMSAAKDFTFAPTASLAAIVGDPRRQIVDINKCKSCHDDANHGTGVVPRLSLHGANRNENLAVCVVCHNPNQTDVPYRRATTALEDPRISGPEVPLDFKTMVHSIHSGGFRTQPFVVIGFRSSVNDFSDVRFPRELRDCTNCHIDASGKGTFELPLRAGVLGTTIKTQSTYLTTPRSIDVDPANDVKISPIAAVCSSCHDRTEVKSHMVNTGGASFSTTQSQIGVTVKERCANCHGPGKDKDVRKAHEIGNAGHDD